ncbi:MAG: hypothetical protein KGZ83_21485 [Sulfuricella sp.]|nr:hypothetical protein [Sulfuricella sp.]
MKPTKVEYASDPGPRGDHVHLYVDNGEASVLRPSTSSGRTDFLLT